MINIGKKLIGEDAAKYLPFALTKARQFAATFTNAYISRTFIVDTATVMVEVFNKGQAQLTIWGGGGGYEFFCTSPTLTKANVPGGISVYLGSAVRLKLTTENDKQVIKASAIGSTLLQSADKKWDYSVDPAAMPNSYLTKGGFQVQGISEFVTFPRLKSITTLTSAWSASSDIANLGVRGGTYGIATDVIMHDLFYDMAPLKTNTGASAGTEVVPDADWYRRATMATVEDPKLGKRVFFLMTTISGDLVVYTDTERDAKEADNSPYADQQIKTDIPAKYAKTTRIVMPSNARTASKIARDTYPIGADSSVGFQHSLDFPQYVWKFNSTGTRMACIAYYMAVEVRLGGHPIMNPDPDHADTPIREELPGLVEYAISIKLTGPNKEDFSVELNLLRDMDPFLTDRVFLSCDYSWKISAVEKPSDPAEPFDLEAINPYAQKKDHLMAAEVEVFKQKGYTQQHGVYFAFTWDQTYPEDMQTDLLILNMTLGTELHRFSLCRPACKLNSRSKTFWHDSAVIAAIDLRIMAWVIQRDIIQMNSLDSRIYEYSRDADYYDDAGDYQYYVGNVYRYDEITRATKLETWVYNKIEEEQYLSEGSPLNPLIDSRAKGVGLQPSQERTRYEKVLPSATYHANAAFPFNQAGYSNPPAGNTDPYTGIVEEDEADARRAHLAEIGYIPPIVAEVFGRHTLTGGGIAVRYGYASTYRVYARWLIDNYPDFTFTPAIWRTFPDGSRAMDHAGAMSVGGGFSPLPIGAYTYRLVGLPSITQHVNDGFTIHPDGHWAVSTSPTVSYGGGAVCPFRFTNEYGVKKAYSLGEPGFNTPAFKVEVEKFVQGFVDIISIKSKTGRLRTSHLEQYNKAYEKEDAKKDYYYKLAEKTTDIFYKTTVYVRDNSYNTTELVFKLKTKTMQIITNREDDGRSLYAKHMPLRTGGEYAMGPGTTGTLIPFSVFDGAERGALYPANPTRDAEFMANGWYCESFKKPFGRVFCGALIDSRPSYLMRFLGPDYSTELIEGEVNWVYALYEPWRGLAEKYFIRAVPSQSDFTYAATRLAGSRIFYGELKGTNRVDHEDDK